MNIDNSCDRMAIHNLNSVQSHGALLGFSWPDARVQVVSQNLPDFFKRPQIELLGSKIEHIFQPEFVDVLVKALRSYPWTSRGLRADSPAVIDGKSFEAYLYFSDGLYFVELEPLAESESQEFDQQTILSFTREAKKLRTASEISLLACRAIRAITGLDRVMMYRFSAPEWHGEVIAEDRITSAHSYLGHRFPATDIPLPARNLYLRNQVRLISDVQSQPVGLTPQVNARTSRPFDLSDSRLRASASVHIEYLKNMGVAASFSIAVADGDLLWGLITCHHMKPLHISHAKRELCEMIANICSMRVCSAEETARLENQLEFDFKLRRLEENLLIVRDPIDQFFRQHRTVTETFNASGVALIGSSLFDFAGLTPLKSDLESLATLVRAEMVKTGKSSVAIDNLSKVSRDWENLKDYVCGVLAVSIPEMDDAILMILRPEMIQTISWGGDPRKNLDKRNFGGEIHPRQSFQTWKESIGFHSVAWSTYEIEALKFLRDYVFKQAIVGKL